MKHTTYPTSGIPLSSLETVQASARSIEEAPIRAVLAAYYASVNRNNLEDTMSLWLPSDQVECSLPGFQKAVHFNSVIY